jgi:hypothetical protein
VLVYQSARRHLPEDRNNKQTHILKNEVILFVSQSVPSVKRDVPTGCREPLIMLRVLHGAVHSLAGLGSHGALFEITV